VRDQVEAQVRDQVRAQVRDQVRDQVRVQVRDQVEAQVEAQVRDSVKHSKLKYECFSCYINCGDFTGLSYYCFFLNEFDIINQHKEKFVPKIIHSIKNGLEVPVYGDGKQIREWIHADDNAAAIYKLLMSDKVKEIYNIGTKERYQNIEILKMIGDVLGKEVNFKYVDDRLGHDRRYALDCDKFKFEFGGIQTIKFKEWLSKNI
jgi:hypothetical protein